MSPNQQAYTDPLLTWMDSSSKHLSIDLTAFGSNSSLSRLNKQRKAYLSKTLPITTFPMTENQQLSFVIATIVKAPRLTIIVPSLRAHLLSLILPTINFNLVHEVIVVHSMNSHVISPQLTYLQNPKIRELFNVNNTGVYGNPERTMGLASIPTNRVGWVYFLDEDNLMHANIWMVMQTHAVSNIILLGAEHCPYYDKDRYHFAKQCKTGQVDTGAALFSTQRVVNRIWLPNQVYDGPFIVDTCKMNMRQVIFLPIVASYHNGLLCDNINVKLD